MPVLVEASKSRRCIDQILQLLLVFVQRLLLLVHLLLLVAVQDIEVKSGHADLAVHSTSAALVLLDDRVAAAILPRLRSQAACTGA